MVRSTLNPPDKARTVGNIVPSDVSTNEQAAYPVVVGERAVALMWIGQIYDQRTEAVQSSSGGKKGK